MSIPDYRIFFRRCAAFFLAGVLAAGSASAQQTEPPSAAPEQAEEAKQEQPQTQPNQSEMDAVIMALCHEITILKKNEEKRMAVREVLVKNADATYNYFDTRVYEMSAVLYALDDQKIFTLAFYCKAATRLVEMYYAQKPDFQEQEERLSKEIERIEKLAESLEEVNTANLSEPSLVQRDEALYACQELEKSLQGEKEQFIYLKELFNNLDRKIDALNYESAQMFTSLFNRIFYTPSHAARYIFLKPLKTYEICMSVWETSADSKLQLPSDTETLKHYGLILLGVILCSYCLARFIVLLGFKKTLKKTGNYNKRHAFTNVTTILIVALILVIASLRTPDYLLESAASLGAEFLLLVSAILFSLVTRLPYGTINSGIRIYMLYDEIGSHKLPPGYISALRKAGVNIEPFNGKRHFLSNILRLNFRNHRKLVVDGTTAFIGGMNIGREYLGKGALGYWRDTFVQLEGPSVQQTQISFLEDWNWAMLKCGPSSLPRLRWEITPQPEDETLLILPSGPADVIPAWKTALIALANSATRRLWIATPYFVPDEGVMAALQAAALRNVDVRILRPERADHILVKLSSFTFLRDLDTYGIQLWAYQKGFLHQKVVLMDDDIATVGTANLDNRSLALNFEITAVIHSPSACAGVKAMLEQDFSSSKRESLADYNNKSLGFKMLCNLARLTAPVQ